MAIKCRFVFKSLSVWQSRADRNICTCWHIFSFSAGLRKSNSQQELGRRICRSQRGFARLLECSWWYRESPHARTRITKSPALRAPSPRQEVERNANHDWLLWQKMQWLFDSIFILSSHTVNKVRRKNNCPQLFSANSSLRVFSKPWQYYFNAKRQLSLVQAVIWPYIYYTEVHLHNETKLA